jgi:uncharacterized protein (TIGR00725 family)
MGKVDMGLAAGMAATDRDTMRLLAQPIAAHQRSKHRFKQPVGLIGPGDANVELCAAAQQIAYALASAGLSIVCGGRGGVMEAAARGASEAGGIAIGLLPEDDDRAANEYLSVAIPTGMGEMRNALIARCSLCLVAVGGGMGTLSEMALGLKLGKRVFCLDTGVTLAGATIVSDAGHAVAEVLRLLTPNEN